jgi:hypothetical protein
MDYITNESITDNLIESLDQDFKNDTPYQTFTDVS